MVQALGHGDDSVLARIVRREKRSREQTRDGSRVQDIALLASLDHPWQEVVLSIGDTEDVDVEDPAPVLDRLFQALVQNLLDLLWAVGRANDGTEYSLSFQEFAALETPHAELAERFRAIAASDDPLNPELCSGIVLAELNAAARGKWARRIRKGLINRPHPLRGISSDMLSEENLVEVREMALHLVDYHQSFVRRGQPNKSDQDMLLDGIANIYVEFAKLDCLRYDLPHAENSRFIQFAYRALRPFFGLTEASLKAISKRWKRLKDANSEGAI